MVNSEDFISLILSQTQTVIELQKLFTAIPALDPKSGGLGEWQKAQLLPRYLPNCELFWVNCPDPALSQPRPNLVAIYKGKSARTLWLFAHLDVVPAGELSLWQTNPWEACVKGDYIFGRGVEDNQQALVSMLTLVKSLNECDCLPELSLGLVFMAAEETGSEFGLKWILDQNFSFFKPDDLYIVPDGGTPDASSIEIAEKAQLWLKFIITGTQCHASTPQAGNNSFLAASALALQLNGLNQYFGHYNPLFTPPYSTFVPSQHDQNVEAINMVPGRDVFYMDCRLLPSLPETQVFSRCDNIMAAIETLYNVHIDREIIQRQEATEVERDNPIIPILSEAIRDVYQVTAKTVGIGGATVASFLRQHGLPAVVWACLENTCHQPNERSSITATLKDAGVFAKILTTTGI